MKNLKKLEQLESIMKEALFLSKEIYGTEGENPFNEKLSEMTKEVQEEIEKIDDLNSEINPNNFHGEVFKSITSIDSAVEKLVGEEVIRFKEIETEELQFETENYLVNVEFSICLYDGMTVETHSIELK